MENPSLQLHRHHDHQRLQKMTNLKKSSSKFWYQFSKEIPSKGAGNDGSQQSASSMVVRKPIISDLKSVL